MSETAITLENVLAVTLTVGQLRDLVRQEVQAGIGNGNVRASKKEWLTAKELAEEYGLPKTWFEERGRTGDIARVKPGRYVLFKRRDVETYLDQHRKFERHEKELTTPTKLDYTKGIDYDGQRAKASESEA
jgi:excisionase family DNA binding protein